MLMVYILFFAPLLLFVAAFLYETYLSFRRLYNSKAGKSGYVNATWEVTHTLLIFALVVLLMMFSKSIEEIASAVFLAIFTAVAALTVRAACYTYIFYVRTSRAISWIDWLFASSHVAAAVALVVAVLQVVWLLATVQPAANTQFVPMFVPGLVAVLAICALPIAVLYRSK